jgi:hypothetical protein
MKQLSGKKKIMTWMGDSTGRMEKAKSFSLREQIQADNLAISRLVINSEAELGSQGRQGFRGQICLARIDHLQVSREDKPGSDCKVIVSLKALLVVEGEQRVESSLQRIVPVVVIKADPETVVGPICRTSLRR